MIRGGAISNLYLAVCCKNDVDVIENKLKLQSGGNCALVMSGFSLCGLFTSTAPPALLPLPSALSTRWLRTLP